MFLTFRDISFVNIFARSLITGRKEDANILSRDKIIHVDKVKGARLKS